MNQDYSIINHAIFLAIILMSTGEVFRVFSTPLYVYALGFALGAYLIFPFGDNRRTHKLGRNKLLILAVSWLIWGLVLMLFTEVHYTFGFYRSLVINLTIILLIGLTATDERSALYYSRAVIVGHIANLGVSIYEFQTGNHLVQLDSYYLRIFAHNALGFQVNVNDNTSALFIGMFLLLISLATTPKYRLGKVISLAVTFYVIAKIGSRTGLLSILLSGSMFLYTYFVSKAFRDNRLRFLVDFAFFTLILLGLVAVFYDNHLISVIVGIFGDKAIHSDLRRLAILNEGIRHAYERMFVGLGPGVVTSKIGTNPHFLLLEILADYGVIILFLFLGVLMTLAKVSHLQVKPQIKSTMSAFSLGFITISVASSSLIRVRVVWIVLAIMFSLHRCYEARSNSYPLSQEERNI